MTWSGGEGSEEIELVIDSPVDGEEETSDSKAFVTVSVDIIVQTYLTFSFGVYLMISSILSFAVQVFSAREYRETATPRAQLFSSGDHFFSPQQQQSALSESAVALSM